MTILQSIIGAIIGKAIAILVDTYKKWQQRKERNKIVQDAVVALKNAKTPEEQERAASELIRVTTPND